MQVTEFFKTFEQSTVTNWKFFGHVTFSGYQLLFKIFKLLPTTCSGGSCVSPSCDLPISNGYQLELDSRTDVYSVA